MPIKEIIVDMGPKEVRVTNEVTGGQKGSKLARYDLIPVYPLHALAEHYGRGALKYEPNNWRKGYNWSLNIAALKRHLAAFESGEDIDEETGSPHLAAVAWHVFALLEFGVTHPELDDRAFRTVDHTATIYGDVILKQSLED